MSSMNRSLVSEMVCNLGSHLNYIPYRQKEKYFSTIPSTVSKRTSFSYRTPASKLNNLQMNKLTKEDIENHIIVQKIDFENQSQNHKILFDSQLKSLNNENSMRCLQYEGRVKEEKVGSINKMEQSISLTTEQFEENNIVQVFNCEQQNKINERNNEFYLALNSLQPVSHSEDSKNALKIDNNEQQLRQPHIESKTQAKQKQDSNVQIKQNSQHMKSIIKSDIKQFCLPKLKKSVKFRFPTEDQNPELKKIANPPRHYNSNVTIPSNSQNFSDVLRKLQKSNKQQVSGCTQKQGKSAKNGKKEQIRSSGSSRLLMRFKKKGEEK